VRTCGRDGASITLLTQGDRAIIATTPSGHHSKLGLFSAQLLRSARSLKGAQTRSRSLSVLVEQAAKQVASLHSAAVILAQDGQPGG